MIVGIPAMFALVDAGRREILRQQFLISEADGNSD